MDGRIAGRDEIEVLVVEDSPTQAEQLGFILEKAGFKVSVAANGKEALSRLKAHRPDIVVTDVVMPEMDGYELCRQIRTGLNFIEMPIILVTALSDPTDVVKGLEAGANNFVTKPYDEKYLLSRIDYLIENRKLRQGSKTGGGSDIFFSGRNYHITAERLQILDLLLSTYENAYHQNSQLLGAQKKLTELNERLEETVGERDAEIAERKQAEAALKKSFERLDILSNTASELLISETPQLVVEALCRRVMGHLDCQAFFNFLVDDERNCLRLNAYAGIPDETAREIHFLDFGVAVCGCAARDACRIVAENIPTTPDIRTDLVRSFGIKAYACHPLIARGRVIGTLSFGTKSRLTFSDDELSLMKTVADQVAAAMERIQLLHKAEERADELESRVQDRTAELRQAYDSLMQETREREQAEARLRQAQKMEALGTLTGGIAHDFNNILAAIIGFAEIAKDRIPPDSQVQHQLARVLEAGIRGRDLVRHMLMFSRQTEQEKKPLPLSSIVKETTKLLRASIPTTIDIRLNIRSESGYVFADPVQMQQVVMNLCANAAHAMIENGGTLDVEISDFHVSSSDGSIDGMKPGVYMKLTVRDSGTGIAPEIVDKIFDPFFTTKKPGEGTGLGLSVVHGIVRQHDGHVIVESEPGRGSAFSVYLPKVAEEEPTETLDENTLPTGNERVLFVDDEEALAEIGQELLEELGYEVTIKGSSIEALSAIKADPAAYDLVITDQTMPELTGVQLAREILSLRPDMPVILCTGFSPLVDSDKARAAGIRAFAMKPLTKREIAKTVRQVLDDE